MGFWAYFDSKTQTLARTLLIDESGGIGRQGLLPFPTRPRARADALSVARSACRRAVIEAGDGRREPPAAARVYVWGVAWRGRLVRAADAGRARVYSPALRLKS